MNLHALHKLLYYHCGLYTESEPSLIKSVLIPGKSTFENYQIILEHYLTTIEDCDRYSIYTKSEIKKQLKKLINILDYINYDNYKRNNNKNLIPSIKIQSKLMHVNETTYLQKIGSLLLDNVKIPDFDKIDEIITRINMLQKYARHNNLEFNLNKKLLKSIIKQYLESPRYV